MQLMPFAEEKTIAQLEKNIAKVNSVTGLLEQGYTPEEVKGFLAAGGMEFVRVFDADTGGAPTDTSEKVIFIAREKGKVRENHE